MNYLNNIYINYINHVDIIKLSFSMKIADHKNILIVILVLIAFSLVSVAIFESFLGNNETSDADQPTSDQTTMTTKIKESSLLKGMTYVSQETAFFCHYASCTMMFKYLQIDTSLREVLYYSGIGYSSLYQNPLLIGSYILSQQPEDIEFLSSLYGLSVTLWYPDPEEVYGETQQWSEYWLRIKQNISNNNPLETSVDPLDLPSLQKQFDLSEEKWKSFQSTPHSIVIVGYNEDNNTVCYFDPLAKYLGDETYGTYAWMSIHTFKEAVTTSTGTKYLLISFSKTTDPLPKNEAFQKAHERNIQRLQGNYPAYSDIFSKLGANFVFGTSASNALKQDFGRGLSHRIKTILLYKIIGKSYRKQNRRTSIYCLLHKIPLSIVHTLFTSESEFYRIGIEKQYIAHYLEEIGKSHEANLFEQEAELWSELSQHYEKFMKRGFLIRLPRALFIMKTMENIMEETLSIEHSIISSQTIY